MEVGLGDTYKFLASGVDGQDIKKVLFFISESRSKQSFIKIISYCHCS